MYNPFLAGRHAITIADFDARDAAATTIKRELSKVIGYYAKHYLNDYMTKAGSGKFQVHTIHCLRAMDLFLVCSLLRWR
ncbi:MAG: hypothetical protein CM15mP58_18570 [Burkholderiaceae bacterium]|nr:MAG: hypothetical protein CM15mP58_18570 [Burkholderiaceae bacterium]